MNSCRGLRAGRSLPNWSISFQQDPGSPALLICWSAHRGRRSRIHSSLELEPARNAGTPGTSKAMRSGAMIRPGRFSRSMASDACALVVMPPSILEEPMSSVISVESSIACVRSTGSRNGRRNSTVKPFSRSSRNARESNGHWTFHKPCRPSEVSHSRPTYFLQETDGSTDLPTARGGRQPCA